MSITAGSLYREAGNFFRHQLITILLMALLTAFISVMISQAMTPGDDQLSQLPQQGFPGGNLMEMVRNLTPEQQHILLRASLAGTLASLIGNTLLTGGMLMLIPLVSAGERTSALRAIGLSAPLLPRLLVLTFLMTLVIQLGFLFVVIPGIILAILLALAPVILAAGQQGIFAAIRQSVSLVWHNMRLVTPAVLFWLLAKMVLLVVITRVLARMPDSYYTLLSVLASGISNLISALLIIYLCRLYMLLR
ncbi:hypothetical protein BL250_06390 [Erwinia sp. OLTSP20]|uniref:YciC family protein n=1 Tax=unclassified Erwinia TaxID=2622719 RepID=UPI000C1A6E9F|nr:MULTISPECIES: YciC family protein [unclassified Erwinia]PIJ51816.1 hypothetical protein BV501_02445 [Erwinia sp. OAMSP11]PIJ74404.1 hypothetical protein BK416_04375 [Erwinia sp. OLSSP12]PIJ83763.1 hypothetical protein BLD47_03750 [Erwinia sp. OLCASP19]PIJ86806.1 hypothetical protein BLD46_02245 [Erwinia sp. OLMTSP26]PIJ88213.1 hypothetical protein BLD49_02925 [Erwinia sp. OLMDSP33]